MPQSTGRFIAVTFAPETGVIAESETTPRNRGPGGPTSTHVVAPLEVKVRVIMVVKPSKAVSVTVCVVVVTVVEVVVLERNWGSTKTRANVEASRTTTVDRATVILSTADLESVKRS